MLFEIRLRHDRDPATEAYQDFVAWVDENSVLGARGAAAEINYAFLPVTRLQSYFDRRQLSKLLEVLFKDDVPPDHRILREKYSKVFCILLYIGKREYIEHFMQHESLNDQRLPFDPQRPTHFPRDPNDQEFFSNFYKTQCMLCVPKFHYNIAEKFEKDRILPITEKCRIDARGSAKIYRIKIHEAYDGLVPLGNEQKVRAMVLPFSQQNCFELIKHRISAITLTHTF